MNHSNRCTMPLAAKTNQKTQWFTDGTILVCVIYLGIYVSNAHFDSDANIVRSYFHLSCLRPKHLGFNKFAAGILWMHFVIWTERYFFVTSISILNSAIKAYLKSWNNFSNDFQGTGSLYLFFLFQLVFKNCRGGRSTVVQNEVQVKKNISLAVHTSFESSVRYDSETVDEKIWHWDLLASWKNMAFLVFFGLFWCF